MSRGYAVGTVWRARNLTLDVDKVWYFEIVARVPTVYGLRYIGMKLGQDSYLVAFTPKGRSSMEWETGWFIDGRYRGKHNLANPFPWQERVSRETS